MSREVSNFLTFLGATAALGLVLFVVGGQALNSAGGPDGAIITHLKQLESQGVNHSLGWAVLVGPKLQFQRMSVMLDADGLTATVTSTLDFTGELRRPGDFFVTRVSSLGLERARYRLRDGDWQPESTDFPRLIAVLETLERRRVEIEKGEIQFDGGVPFPGTSERVYRSEAWFIRSEREEVTVSEDSRFQGKTPERPVDEKSTRRLVLYEEGDGLFRFPK